MMTLSRVPPATLSRLPPPRAGSSVRTVASGSAGMNSPAETGLAGSRRSTACRPLPCQVISARSGLTTVGLCAENEVKFSVRASWPSGVSQNSGRFSASLYSASTCGARTSLMSRIRVQPHGQPCSASTPPNFP